MFDPKRRGVRRGQVAWCFYDWANSAFPTVILSFVFATYFTQAVAVDPIKGQIQWGYTQSLGGLALALAAPFLGVAADRSGHLKQWMGVFTALCCLISVLLWMVEPHPDFVPLAMILVAVGIFAFETAQIFYNAFLPRLVGADRIGRLSGWAWGLGYGGGLACLGLALLGFVGDSPLWFGLDPAQSEGVRAIGPLVGIWLAVFSLPLFFWTPETKSRSPVGAPSREKMAVFRIVSQHVRDCMRTPVLWRFFLAHMLYKDGLVTLFAFGGVFAAGVYGLGLTEVVIFGIAINVTAGLGAFIFAWIDDLWGSRQVILISLIGLIILGSALILGSGKPWFWIFGLTIGFFIGPVQSASRSLMAHLTPPGQEAANFGLFALSGKATAFIGPALLAWVTSQTGSQRAGMATLFMFLAAGAILLGWGVRDVQKKANPQKVNSQESESG